MARHILLLIFHKRHCCGILNCTLIEIFYICKVCLNNSSCNHIVKPCLDPDDTIASLRTFSCSSGTSVVLINLLGATWNQFIEKSLSRTPCLVPRVNSSLLLFITTAITFLGASRPRSTSGMFTNTLSYWPQANKTC